MTKRLLTLAVTLVMTFSAWAQNVVATWGLSDKDNLAACDITGSGAPFVTNSLALGAKLTATRLLTASTADAGYTAVTYDPAFIALQPAAQVSSATSGHNVAVGITPTDGHKFKPTKISFDACKVGTDGGGIVVKVKESGGTEVELGSATPLRNKIQSGNSTGYSHHEFYVNDYNVEGKGFIVVLYITGVGTNKELALRNIRVEGDTDSKVWSASDFISTLTCNAKTGTDEAKEVSLYDIVKDLKNGETARYATKLYAQPPTSRLPQQRG